MTDNHAWTGPTKAAEGMHPDLIALAEVCEDWPDHEKAVNAKQYDGGRVVSFDWRDDGDYTKAQWLQARKDLGLIMSDEEMEMDVPERSGSVPSGVQTDKQLRYLDAKGDDWIDEFARTATVDEFRGAMRFTIGKYNRRAGKKDELIKEIEKMEDYCRRWKEYERGLL